MPNKHYKTVLKQCKWLQVNIKKKWKYKANKYWSLAKSHQNPTNSQRIPEQGANPRVRKLVLNN
jgi:hypothetical protein